MNVRNPFRWFTRMSSWIATSGWIFWSVGWSLVELKAVEALLPVHEAQVITYLKLTGCKLGMLFNFNVRLMRDGIHRVAYHL
jgi:PD-(D/E)XK nuclease superfamily